MDSTSGTHKKPRQPDSTSSSKAKAMRIFMQRNTPSVVDLLHKAAKASNWSTVKMLLATRRQLDSPFDLNEGIGDDSQTLLIAAVTPKYNFEAKLALRKKGQYLAVEELLKAGADVNKADRHRQTPLMYASKDGQIEIVQLLLANRANVHKTNLRSETALHQAAEAGHDDVVNLLLQHRPIVDRLDMFGNTPLKLAAHRGHADVVNTLLENGAGVNYTATSITPLHDAAKNGKVDVVIVLLNHGANMDATTTGGMTALMHAAAENRIYVIQALLTAKRRQRDASVRQYVNVQNLTGRTAIALAAENGCVLAALLLLNAGSDLNLATDRGRTPLSLACINDKYAMVQLLALGPDGLRPGNDLNHQDYYQCTPLRLAVERENVDIVRLLLQLGADSRIKDNLSRTPLEYAQTREGWSDEMARIVNMLRDAQVPPDTGASTSQVSTADELTMALDVMLLFQ